ncbi:hypothetical protein BVV32_08050 [Staphylococcus aureus]|nr:hypothetical protein BVV32_08050 [Staphylococcus aureus]
MTLRHILCWGPPQLAWSVEFLFEILYVGAPPQLAWSVEFLFEILYVGAPPQLALSVEIGGPISLCWGP